MSGPGEGDRVCYKAKCRAPYPPNSTVTEEFGTRTVTGLRTSLYCVPAFLGSAHYTDSMDA